MGVIGKEKQRKENNFSFTFTRFGADMRQLYINETEIGMCATSYFYFYLF